MGGSNDVLVLKIISGLDILAFIGWHEHTWDKAVLKYGGNAACGMVITKTDSLLMLLLLTFIRSKLWLIKGMMDGKGQYLWAYLVRITQYTVEDCDLECTKNK